MEGLKSDVKGEPGLCGSGSEQPSRECPHRAGLVIHPASQRTADVEVALFRRLPQRTNPGFVRRLNKGSPGAKPGQD